MFMSQSQMVEKVKAAHQAWGVIGNREMRPAGWEGPRLLLEPPLVEHFSILPLTTWSLRQRGWDVRAAMDRFGLHKLMTWRIDTFPPELREHYWLSMAGLVAAVSDLGRDSYLRAVLGKDWQQRLYEELPAAARLAFHESGPHERLGSDRIEKGRSIVSRAKRLMLETSDEAAAKPKRVTRRQLEPEEMELALFARQEAQGTWVAAEEDFFAYLSGLKPHQGETHGVVIGTSNVTVTRVLDEVKAKIPFTKREARVFDLLRETSDRHNVAHCLGVEPESVTRTKNRIKHKIKKYPRDAIL